MNKSIPIGKVKEEIKIDEEHWVERAEQFFEASLKETNEKNAAVAFGKGLANFITIYENRSWWEQKSFLKSYKTGIRPVYLKIKEIQEVNPNDNDKVKEKFEQLVDVLQQSVLKNHSIKAFKSRLETHNLRKILSGITGNEEKVEDNGEKIVNTILKKIGETKNEKDWEGKWEERLGLYKTGEDCFSNWLWGALFFGVGALAMVATGCLLYALGGILSLIEAGVKKAAGTNYAEAVSKTLGQFRKELCGKLSKYVYDIQSGIKRQYIMNKVEMGKDNEKDLKELEKETKEQLKKNKKTK